ncbi:MAG: UDP-N-acetylmuramate--L-alanine ligase, partial [Pseudomonadota bacterium]
RAIRSRGALEPVFVDDADKLPTTLANIVRPGDLLLTMGAGNVGAMAQAVPEKLREALHLRKGRAS